MSAAKHTPSIYRPWEPDGDCPAPWSVEDTDERVHVSDAQGGLIADCTNGFDGDEGWVMSAACGPLARLIAAAPELLDELRAMVGLFMDRYPTKGLDDEAQERINAARAAIAKATGSTGHG
jgi:hypothetical protein